MRRLFATLLVVFAAATGARAQMIKDPTDWTFSVKKKDAKHYTVLIHTSLKPTWHMYALRPGGDGTLIPTVIKFGETAGVTRTGSVRELTKPMVQTIEGVDGKVALYAGKADFAQDMTGAAGKVVTGTVEYQTCSDQMCLPPKKKNFSITLP